MRDLCLRLVALCLAVAIAGCSSFHPVPDWPSRLDGTPTTPGEGLTPGDRLRVTTATGERIELQFTGVEDRTLLGLSPDAGSSVRIPLEGIRQIERLHAGAGVYAGVLVGALAFWALVFALVDAFVAMSL